MLATPDLNNNTIMETHDNQSKGLPGLLPEETEMRLSIRNNCLHLHNPQFGTWIPVDNLAQDKKVYLYHALASNITNQLKDVGNSVRRQLKLSEFGTATGFKFLAGIRMDSKDLGTGDEKKIYTSAIHAVSEELSKFNDLHDELDKYYGKLRTNWEPGSDGLDQTLPGPEKLNENLSKDLEERLFINVPWDWDSSFLTSKEFPAFSNMASKAKITNKRLENGNTSLVKVFKKSQDRPPMEPTWLKSLGFPTSEIDSADKGLKTRDQGIPCVILRKLGLFYGNNGEQSHNFELITGKEFRGNYKLLDHLLPATFPDILDRAQIVYPIAFRYVGLSGGPKCGDLCDEVDQPRPLDLGIILRTIQGLSTGSWNSINKAEQAILRTLQSLDTRNDQFVFQRSIQNVHMYGDYESTSKLKLMMERINGQSDALRLLASTGSESVGYLLKLFQTITSRLLLIKADAEKDTDQGNLNIKNMIVGKAGIPGEDILRTDFEDWFRSASTIPMLTEMSATSAGVAGILHKLQDAYQQVGSALLNVVSNPADGVKLNFEECMEAICALLILAESVIQASLCEDWLIKDLLNTVEETKNALLSLKGTINRISACAEVLQNTSDSAVSTLQEITVMRKKQYEKDKKKEEGGFWRFSFLKDKKTTN